MSWLRALPLSAVLLGIACQNNTIELDTDGDTGDASTSTGSGSADDGVPTATVASMTAATSADTGVTPVPGTLLLAIDTILQPGLPFQALVTMTPGNGTVDLTMQFLSLDLGSTTSPRQPVGDVYAYPGIPLDESGGFVWEVGVVLIPGAANPITGSDTVVALALAVRPQGSPFCGEAGGTVTMPIEAVIDGSTHAMTEIFDVNALPVDFPVACP